MSWRKFFSLTFAAVILLSLLPGLGLAQEPAAVPPSTDAAETQQATGKPLPAAIGVDPLIRKEIAASPDGKTDFFIAFKDTADLSSAYTMNWQDRGRFVVNTLQAVAEASQTGVRKWLEEQGIEYTVFWINNTLFVHADEATLNALAAFPEVSGFKANHVSQIFPDDSVQESQPAGQITAPAYPWNITFPMADQVHSDFGIKGQGVVVGGMDTGVEYTHMGLVNNYRGNLGGGSFDHTYSWYDPSGSCGGTPCDTDGHGTATHGIMTGDDDPALPSTAWIGMAPDAKWIHCIGCPYGSCPDFDTNACAQWFLAPGGDSDLRPQVVNHSWGLWSPNDCDGNSFQAQLMAYRAADIVPAFAAGNVGDACNTSTSPANNTDPSGNPIAFASGAHGPGGSLDYYSSCGWNACNPTKLFPDVASPGQGSCTTQLGNTYYCGFGGTSSASPHTAGCVALVRSANPSLSVEEVEQIIRDAANDVNDTSCGGTIDWNNRYGEGHLDCYEAVQMANVGTGTLDGHVYDSSTMAPIEDATIEATLSPTQTWQTTTDDQGYYAMDVLTGTYEVEASAWGYIPDLVTGVDVYSGTTTTQDFSLDPAASALVYGYVTDATTGWPLYASIDIAGYPNNPVWTDPVTGYYEVTLPEGSAYDFTVEAWVPGYLPETASVGPIAVNAQADFALDVDAATCEAPGYSPLYSYSEDFEADDGGYTHSGTYDEWEWGTPVTWPGGCASGDLCWGTDLDNTYENSANNQLLSPVIDLSGASGPLVAKWWQAWHIESATYDHAYAEVSINGGPWTEMWAHTGSTVQVDWTQLSYDISAAAGTNVQFRWRMTTDTSVTYSGYYIDLVTISSGCDPADGGLAVGYVYDLNTSDPLDGADVWNDSGEATVTSDGGFYTLFSPPGLHDFYATADGYGTETANLNIIDGGTVGHDFYLGTGYLTFTPTPLEATVNMGASTVVNALLENSGTAAAEFELVEVNRGFEPTLVMVPAFEGELVPDAAPPSTDRAPTAPQPSGELPSPLAFPLAGEPAYALDVYPGYNLVYIPDTTVPGTWNVVASVPQFHPAADFLNGDFSTLYALDYDSNQFVAIDTTTGARTVIGTAVGNGNWTGLTGATDGTLYASSSVCGTSSTLYEIDPATGALTQIGNITNGTCIIDIAINAAGEMYGVDIVNDVLVQIDPATGAGTVIGSLGASANYAQGMDFEEETGILYWAAYTASGELRIIDTNTGASTLVGAFPGGAEVDGLAFATGGAGGDVPWLSEDPISGTVPAPGSVPIDVTFDAGVPEITQPGEYYATLKVNNDTVYGPLQVPVTLTVIASETYGKLRGWVYGLGYCDGDLYPLEDAEVLVEGSSGMTWTLATDDTGYYQIWLDQAESLLDITVTYPEHEVGYETGVSVVGQQTTTVSFDLRWLMPCLSVAPDSLSASLQLGETDVQQVTLTNDGAAEANFEMVEVDQGFEPTLVSIPRFEGQLAPDAAPPSTERAPKELRRLGQPADPLSFPLAGAPAYALDVYPGYNLVYFPDITVPGGWTIIGSVPQFHPAADFLNGDFSTLYALDYDSNQFVAIDTATAARTVIGTAVGNGNWTGLTGATDGTLYASSSVCGTSSTLYEIDPATGALTQIGNITNGTCIIDIAINAAGEMYGVDIVNDALVQIDPATGAGTVIGSLGVSANYAQGMDFEEETGVLYWAAYTTQGELRVIDTATGASIPVGPFPGGAEVDGLAFATGGAGGDVPWLSEDPISGTVPAPGSVPIDVTFDAGAVAQPGEYYATLNVKSNDPENGTIGLPVTMTVTAPGTWGKLTGVVAGLGYCDGEYYPLADATVEIVGGISVTTDADGVYVVWLEAGTYTVVASADGHTSASAEVTISGGETTTQDLDLRSIEPCLSVAPLAMESVLLLGESQTQTLTLTNAGAGDGEFEIEEMGGSLTPTLRIATPEAITVLLVDDDDNGVDARPYYEAALNAVGVAYDVWDTGGGGGAGPDAATMSDYAAVIWFAGHAYDGGPSATDKTQIGLYLDDGGSLLLSAQDYLFSFGVDVFLTTYFGVASGLSDAGGWSSTSGVPGDPVGDGFPNMSVSLPSFDWTDTVVPVAGASASFDYNGTGSQYVALTYDNGTFKTMFWGAQWEAIQNASSANGAATMEAILDFLAVPAVPIPWLTEDPTEGTVEADDTFDVEVTFTALPTMTYGTYTGTLVIGTDDASNPEFSIPVTLTIVTCVEMTGMEMTLLTPDPVVGVPVEFEVDMTPDDMSMPYNYRIIMDDGTVYEGESSDDPHGFSHVYTEAGTYMVEFQGWNCEMTTPMTDTLEIEVSEAVQRYYLPIVLKNF